MLPWTMDPVAGMAYPVWRGWRIPFGTRRAQPRAGIGNLGEGNLTQS